MIVDTPALVAIFFGSPKPRSTPECWWRVRLTPSGLVACSVELALPMTVDVTTEIVIARPRERVAAYASDPDNVPAWYKNIKSVEWKTPQAVAVGSKVAFVAQFLGRRLAYTYKIVDYAPGERIVMRTEEGPFPMETTYTWESVPTGTLMRLRNRGTPTGFSLFIAPFMKIAMRRANQNDLSLLKQVLER